MRSYQYAGLAHVKRPGLSVEECVSRLRSLAYAEERLMQLQAIHIITRPEWDLKILLGRTQYEDATHADQLKKRLPELRISKKKAFETFHESPLKVVFDEAVQAANTAELLAALTQVLKPAMIAAYQDYLNVTNGLADYPSVRILKTLLVEEQESLELLGAAFAGMAESEAQKEAALHWADSLQTLLEAAGGVDGTGTVDETALKPIRATEKFVIPREAKRDDTYQRIWDFLHVDNARVAERFAQMVATRLSEITAAEGLVFVLCEVADQPWEFYVDISRHLWDEVRHTLFGEAATEEIFDDRAAMPIRDFDMTYIFQMTPLEQYAGLGIGIEAAMMKYPPGKREEYEFCRDTVKHPLMTTFQDFDWADEVLHVNIARRQLKDWFPGSFSELVALAEKEVKMRGEVRHWHPPSPLPDMSHVLENGE